MKRLALQYRWFVSLTVALASAGAAVAGGMVQGCSAANTAGPGATAGADGGKDNDPTQTPVDSGSPAFAGPPVVDKILPLVAVSGGYVYILGQNLARTDGTAADVTITVKGKDANGMAVAIPLTIFKSLATRLVASVPADMDTRVKGKATISVTTPLGNVDFASPLFVVKDTGFGGAAKPGYGFLGEVFALKPNTPTLPDFANPCADPKVLPGDAGSGGQTADASAFTCPHTYILVPNFDVPVRAFTDGFPGLGDSLVEWFAIHFTGFLKIDVAGAYTFQSCSDDGSNVYLESAAGTMTKIVSNDGTHGMGCANSTPISLSPGVYPMVVDYFQGPRTQIGLQLKWQPPPGVSDAGTGLQIVPADNLVLFKEAL